MQARNLPVIDRQTGTTDGFVLVRFAGREDQTSVKRKTLTPRWDEDFRFDVQDDATLQNEPLELRVLDSGSFSTNNKIGSCFISLNPLLRKPSKSQGGDIRDQSFTSGLSGWFPVFDTLEGIRGELFATVKVENVADENPYSEASGAVEFFSSSWLDPQTVAVERVMGFVEELVVDSDPEVSFLFSWCSRHIQQLTACWQYAWSNSFHTARASNDARLQLLYRLAMEVYRLVGKKAIEIGANAVLGYVSSLRLNKRFTDTPR